MAERPPGGLRCIVTRTGDDTFGADYHATYWKLFGFGYAMPLRAGRREGDTVHFNGDADLGWLAGGNYHYDGRATGDEFYCTYRSRSDHGYFKMTRPGGRGFEVTRASEETKGAGVRSDRSTRGVDAHTRD